MGENSARFWTFALWAMMAVVLAGFLHAVAERLGLF
jgi:hypothetical protein